MRAWWAVLAVACGGSGDDKVDGTDADADADADSDADSDADADADADSDADTDPPAPDRDGDGSPDAEDCAPDDPDVYPGAPDVCGDDLVFDCDRTSDDGLVTVDGAATFTDLQLALDAATAGASVLVCPGTYVGAFTASVPVALTSHGGTAVTLLDGGSQGTTLTLPDDSAITGFEIVGGRGVTGGGVHLTGAGTATLTDLDIHDNGADEGAGLAVDAGITAIVDASDVHANRATAGGGVAVSGGSVDLTGSTVQDNEAAYAGGVLLEGGALIGGVVRGNVATQAYYQVYPCFGGGGICGIGDIAVTGTEVTDNEGFFGAGTSFLGGVALLTDVTIQANASVGGLGGGILLLYADATLVGASDVTDNLALAGGGAFVEYATLSGGTFERNVADLSGGGILAADAEVHDARIEDNMAAYECGGIAAYGLTLTGGTVVGNQSGGPCGGVGISTNVYLPSVAPAVFLDGVTLTDNSAAGSGGGLWLGAGMIEVANSEVLRNTAALGGGAALEGGTFVSTATDWGAGADDNVPDDVLARLPWVGYEAAETFTCDLTGCTPEP